MKIVIKYYLSTSMILIKGEDNMLKLLRIIVGALFIIFGIYLWTHPAETLISYSLYLGLIQLTTAIVAFIVFVTNKMKPIPYASIIISALIGIVILSLPLLSLGIILWIFIFAFLATSILSLYNFMHNREKTNILYIIIASLAVLYGFIMLFRPITAANTLAKILAVFVIINGVSYIISEHKLTKV